MRYLGQISFNRRYRYAEMLGIKDDNTAPELFRQLWRDATMRCYLSESDAVDVFFTVGKTRPQCASSKLAMLKDHMVPV